jgi:vacuolar-type H+-ATPase subunit I/STV1
METITIVLVLAGMCTGALLVLLASAYRSLQAKVNVTEYSVEQMELQRDVEQKFNDLYNEVNTRVDSLIQMIDDNEDHIENTLDDIRGMIDNVEGRIDSRADKLWAEIDKIEETLVK